MSASDAFMRLVAMKDLCADLEAAGYRIVGPGEMDEVWLVSASVGEYSDRSVWICDVWQSEEDAQEFIRQINYRGRIAIQAESRYLDKDEGDDRAERDEWDRAAADCRALDAGWSTYNNEAPVYLAWKEAVRPAALRSLGEGKG